MIYTLIKHAFWSSSYGLTKSRKFESRKINIVHGNEKKKPFLLNFK